MLAPSVQYAFESHGFNRGSKSIKRLDFIKELGLYWRKIMDNEELTNMLLECIEKLKDDTFEVDIQTECYICKVADSILNGEKYEI